MAIEATYTIGSADIEHKTSLTTWSKVYDGTPIEGNSIVWTGLRAGDTKQYQLTNDYALHVGIVKPTMDDGYPQIYRNGVNVTSEYTFTQIETTFTVTERDVTLKSASLTKEYDGTALTAYSQAGGTDVQDLTAGLTDKGYVSGEEFTYTFTGSQLFVGSSDNTFTVSDNQTAQTGDYNETLQYGKLTVTKRTVPVTITVSDQEWLYDGTTSQFDKYAYTVTGELATGDSLYVTLSCTNVDAGSYKDGITATYKIVHSDGTDVTDMYAYVTVDAGDLTIDKRSVTLTSASDSKVYDGTPLTNSNVAVTGDGFASGEGATYDVTGTITNVGTTTNTFSYTLKEGTKADNYDIATAKGTLEITKRDVVITIGTDLTTGLTYLYDNTATKVLEENNGYIVSGLAAGESLANVTITINSSNAGIYDENMYTVTYDIVNASGVSTKSNYNVTLNKNDVEITKRTITIEADSASKVYDGTALTCGTYTVTEGATEEYQLLAGESVKGVGFTADSTITHAGSTANKVDASNVTITKADGSDSSMNYNILTEDGTLTVTQRGVLLQSTSADKYYDGTALQNRQVVVTGFHYDSTGKVVVDENAGFLAGDGCTYDFRNDNVVIDKDGNIIAWTVSEQSDTAYGQTEVGTSKNEFDYNNFTSVKYGSFESDYIIIYGDNQESLGLGKDEWDLYGNLTVWGGPVEINMTDYAWTYDYQAKTNGYFDDGYTVVVTTNAEGTETETTEVAHNSEGGAIALLGSDTIVVNVEGEDGSGTKVQHVGTDKQNEASYTIYRNGVDVTAEVEKYYTISITGGLLQITPRTVEITSASSSKVYDGTALTDNTVIEGSEGRDKGFIFGEGAAYTVTGSQTEVGASANTFAIEKLLTDTKAADYNFVLTEGTLMVTGEAESAKSDINGTHISDVIFQYAVDGQLGYWMDGTDKWQSGNTGALGSSWTAAGAADMNADGKADVVMVGNFEDSAIIGYYKNGDGTDWTTLGSANADVDVKLGNLTGNAGCNSVVLYSAATGELSVWQDGDAENSKVIAGSLSGSDWALTGTGDFNGDGVAEAVLTYANGGFYTLDLDGNFNALANLGTGWEIKAIGDFSNDGTDDLVIFNEELNLLAKLGDGKAENFETLGQLDGSDWFVVGAGNYNGDLNDDLLVRQNSTGMLGYYADGDMNKWNTLGYGVDMNWTVIA